MLYRAEEDYIKTIYELSLNTNNHVVKSIDIANSLDLTIQSVNEMVKKLAKKAFLDFIPYKGVKLTAKGRSEAIRLVRSHRIWEVFLMDHLGFSWEEVHTEAESLEHAASMKVIDKLYTFIGKPKYCMHGNPIPDEDGNTDVVFNKTLYKFKKGDTFTLKRVLDNHDLLTFLNINNVNINDSFIINEIDDFNETISFQNSDLIISYKVAKMMFGI